MSNTEIPFEVVEQREWTVHMRGQSGEIEEVVNTWERRLPEAPELEDLFVRQAPPSRITPSRRVKPTRSDTVAFVIPDVQIGYRGEETFHDERAIALGMIAMREVQPDQIILIGDIVDLPSVSRWGQDPIWANGVQRGLDRTHELLAQTRANAPDADIYYLSGNHELRLRDYIMKNAAELLGIKRANASEELGVLTMQFLLRCDELEINYLEGYPAAALWLQDNLKATHGVIAKPTGKTAPAVLASEGVSTIFGHTHRIEHAYATQPTRDGYRTIQAASFGTWSKITGEVPHGRQSIDEHDQIVKRPMNWQQSGGGIVQHNERNHHMEVVPLDDEGIILWGRRYGTGE
jgi:UDP-2,3-diacylglucosamine pyrophosphatase LpxH